MRGFAFLVALCGATSICAAELVTHRIATGTRDLALYEKHPAQTKGAVLLIHGRTFSALPNFDLQVEGEKRSVMDALVAKGYAAYALDLPGYGASPRDKSGWITPNMAANDIAATLKWIAHKNGIKPFLLGYSMGSTHCQLVAQRYPELISGLILFGYWRDIDVPIEADPIMKRVAAPSDKPLMAKVTEEKAREDFITPGSISKRGVDAYVREALRTTPVRPDYKDISDYAALDPKKVTVPTLIIQGEFDGALTSAALAKVFTNLGTSDRQWVIIPKTDHAALVENTAAFVNSIVSFIER